MSEQDPEPDYVIMSDQGLKDFIPPPIHQVNNGKAQTPAAIPPPLPPRLHQKSPTLGKASSQSPQSKAFKTETKSAKLPANNQSQHLKPGEVPGAHSSCLHGILPTVEQKCQLQFSPRLPLKSEINPSWHDKSQTPETNERNYRQTQEAELKIIQNRQRQETNGQEWDPTKRKGQTGKNEKISQIQSVETDKPSRQILVLFTDQEEFMKNRENKGKGKGDGNIWSTIQTLTSDRSKSSPVQGLNEASANRKCTSEPMCPQPPPKPPRKHDPNLQAVSRTQAFSAVMTGEEEVEKRRKQEDGQRGDKVLVGKESDEKLSQGKDKPKLDANTDTATASRTEMHFQTEEMKETHILKSSVSQEAELQRGEQRFDLKPPNRSKQPAAITGESETVQDESQHQHEPDPPPQEAVAWINTTSTDSSMEVLKWTESNREKQKSEQSGQDGEAFSKLPSGQQTETEVTSTTFLLGRKGSKDTQDGAEMLPDGPLKQTNHKANTKHKMKHFGMKMICRLKKGKEEKRRVKVGELEHDETVEDDAELTLDDGETDEGMKVLTLDVSGAQTNLMERSFKRRHGTSRSPFGSFEVCSPVTLMDDLLSGDEWSRYLNQYQSTQHDPPPHQTLPEDTAQLSVAEQDHEQDRKQDVFEAGLVVPEESVYEDFDGLTFTTEDRQQGANGGANTAEPITYLENEKSPMSPRTKEIYDTVQFIQTVAPVNTDMNFSDIKSEGVLDTTVQKYLVRLSKKRKHRAGRKRCRLHGQAKTLGQTPSPVCPQHVFPASVFYSLPVPGVEDVSAVKPGGSSPKCLTKIKMALKDKTMHRTAQAKEEREK